MIFGKGKSGQIFLQFCHNSRVWQTDRIISDRPRLHSMQRGNDIRLSASSHMQLGTITGSQ